VRKRRRRVGIDVRREITKYLPLVKAIARRVVRGLPGGATVAEIDDFVSVGVIGLMDAAERFDPTRNDRFERFAGFRIEGAMQDYLRSQDNLSRDTRRLSNKLRDAVAKLESELCRAPTSEELAEHLGIGLDKLRERQGKLSGSSVVGIDDAGPDLLDRVGDESAADPFEVAERREMAARISEAVAGMSAQAQRVLLLYYRDELLLWQIGALMGVTESRVCQIHVEAIRGLRDALAQTGPVQA
jgi:RNA polymerase sigma factor for flagellar operon FliA